MDLVPVIIWFHGGGYIFGHKNQHNSPWGMLQGASLGRDPAEEGIVWVCITLLAMTSG
jgi:carboxylesterase type B